MVFVVSANRPAPVEGEFRSSRQQVAMVRSPIRPSRETGVIRRSPIRSLSRGASSIGSMKRAMGSIPHHTRLRNHIS